MVAWLRADPRRGDLLLAIITVAVGVLLIEASPQEFDTGWPEVAAGVGAFVLVLARRTQPLLLLAVGLLWGGVHVATLDRPAPLFFAVLVLLVTACVRLDRRPAIAVGIVVAVALYTFGLWVNESQFADDRVVIGIVWAAGAVGIADATRSWRRYKESADAQIRSAVLAAEAQTRHQVSEERLAIARELHDLLAHNLSVMNVQTGAALHLLRSDPDQAEQSLTAARDAGRSVLDELRELLSVLRHHGDDDAPTASLPTADQLPQLVETMRTAGLEVAWSRVGGPRTLAPAVSLAAYRITQEALTNAAKHGTGTAELRTEWDDLGLTIHVANAVTTDEDPSGGHGLVGMRERAAANGGRLTAESTANRFVVTAWLPAAPAPEHTA